MACEPDLAHQGCLSSIQQIPRPCMVQAQGAAWAMGGVAAQAVACMAGPAAPQCRGATWQGAAQPALSPYAAHGQDGNCSLRG